MLSKNKLAYKWALHVALPFAVGQSSVDLKQCISSDSEEAILQPIDESKQHIGGFPKKIRHTSLDFYYMFIQVWNQKCVALSYAPDGTTDILNTIKDWVYSWVTELETEQEFLYSVAKYDKYFSDVKVGLGDHLAKEIELAGGHMLSNIEKVGSHYFERVVAVIVYIGSSIVKGTNVGIR